MTCRSLWIPAFAGMTKAVPPAFALPAAPCHVERSRRRSRKISRGTYAAACERPVRDASAALSMTRDARFLLRRNDGKGRGATGSPRADVTPQRLRREEAVTWSYAPLSWSRMLDQSLPEPPPLLATMVPLGAMPTYVACERMLKSRGVSGPASAKIQS